MKKLFMFLIVFLSISGCTMNMQPSTESTGDIIRSITYGKDMRTGICYGVTTALGSDGFSSITITYVPCDSLKKVHVGQFQPTD